MDNTTLDFILKVLPVLGGGAAAILVQYILVGKGIFSRAKAKNYSEEISDIASMNETFRDQLQKSNIALISLQQKYLSAAKSEAEKSLLLSKYDQLLDYHFKNCNFDDEDLAAHHQKCKDINKGEISYDGG